MNQQMKSIRILFVEDSLDDAELAVHHLENDGFIITWEQVYSDAELRRILMEWEPDLILSDYSMPGFNGHAALKICQELTPFLPFIFLSGTIGEELAIESIRMGATDYVLKENMRRLGTSVTRAINDTVERRHAHELAMERSRLIDILEATSDCVGIFNPDESLVYLNTGALTLLGLDTEISSLTLNDLLPRQQLKIIKQYLNENSGIEKPWQHDAVMLHRDGSEIPVSMVMIGHYGRSTTVEYYSFIARDLRDRQAYEERIQILSHYDPLTGMPNRALLADRTAQAISFSHWSNRTLAVLIIDIDRFKLVNDGYGHEFGDELLKSFASRLRTIARTRDTIARLSADCFAILATELTSAEDVIILISRLQQEMATPFQIHGLSISVTTGVGVSLYPRDGKDFNTLMRNADVAMHRMKQTGKSGFQFYTMEMTQNAEDRVRLENELQHALPLGQLELYYQIQVELQTNRIKGMEALMRWKHPERGMISPDVFIPIAENSELICKMGEWALYTACRQVKEWDQYSSERLRIAVNVSVRQFLSEDFTEMIERLLVDMQLDPDRLELEITESVLVHDQEEAAAILQRLNSLGVQISLDDFGTGYSNLNYLSRLPIHRLKIDKSFVQRSINDKNDMEIVRAVISLAESLGLRVIAEGIETSEQLEMLRLYQCAEGQGYYFAKPVPAHNILEMLKTETISGANYHDE